MLQLLILYQTWKISLKFLAVSFVWVYILFCYIFLFPFALSQLLYLNMNWLQILWTEINELSKSLNSTQLRYLLLTHAMAFGIWLIPHSTDIYYIVICELEAYYCLVLLVTSWYYNRTLILLCMYVWRTTL